MNHDLEKFSRNMTQAAELLLPERGVRAHA